MRFILGILKNLLVFFVGGLVSLGIVGVFSAHSIYELFTKKDIGLAVIALLPVLFVYGVALFVAGGFLGVIIYNVRRFFIRKARVALK